MSPAQPSRNMTLKTYSGRSRISKKGGGGNVNVPNDNVFPTHNVSFPNTHNILKEYITHSILMENMAKHSKNTSVGTLNAGKYT